MRPRSVRRNRRSLCSKVLGCWLFCQLREELDCESSGNRGFGRSREGTESEHVLESLVAHRLIDLGSEWHLHRHRYEHSAREIYLAKTMRWHPKTSCIVVWTYSWIGKLPFSTVSKAGGRIYPAYSASSCNVRRA